MSASSRKCSISGELSNHPKSLLGFCDEVVVLDGGDDFGVYSAVRNLENVTLLSPQNLYLLDLDQADSVFFTTTAFAKYREVHS